MKKISSIAMALIIGMSLLIGDPDHAESKLYASFTMSITDLDDVPDHDSEKGENLIRLEFPKGKEAFYLNVVTRRGKQSNTFQLGIRGTRSNKAIFCGINLSVDSTYTIAFSIENRNRHDRRDEKNSAIAKLWINPDFDAPECTENVLQRVKEFPFSLTEMVLQVAPRFSSNAYIYNERTSSEWGAMALPVELVAFSAAPKGKNIELKWNTATEVNNAGFAVQRRTVHGSSFMAETSQWKDLCFIEGAGTTNAPKSYSYVDANVSGTVSYRLKQIDRDGKFEYSQEVEIMIMQRPQMFALMQNYPNPFNPNTVISYQLPVNSAVTLTVFDAIGREVATLVSEVKEAGTYTAKFDGSKLSSGIYFYRLQARQTNVGQAGNFTATKKLTLMK